ncbi:MAG: hypothetical protein ACOY46_12905 [Bacillota bacterium]
MADKKKEKKGHEKCEACDVLGDYMCAGSPANPSVQAQDIIKKE